MWVEKGVRDRGSKEREVVVREVRRNGRRKIDKEKRKSRRDWKKK